MMELKPYKGYRIEFLHTSYSCPSLKLYGYATDLALFRAIKKVIKKRKEVTPK